MISLVILLMSIAAIGRLVDMGTDRSVDTQLQSRGTRLAQSKLAEVEAGVVPVSTGGGGSFDTDPEWSWSVESAAAGPVGLYRVTVRVSRDLRGQPFEVTLTQYVLDPQAQGAAGEAPMPETTDTTTSGGTGGTTP